VASPEVVPRRERRATIVEPIGRVRQNRVGSGDLVVTGDSVVTSGELKILALLADGLCFDSVAARVAVSPRTLRRRLRCVCERLGVAHPVQAIVWAARRGLI
jgi:DNA-binding NarL/FixJ family response regulator